MVGPPGGADREYPCTPTPPASSPSWRPCSEKGAALGTVLAFMMAVIALSLPEMVILRRVLSLKLIAVFVGVVATGIVIVGYVFNVVV